MTRMEPRTSVCRPTLAVVLLGAGTLVSMVTSSSLAAGVLDFNMTADPKSQSSFAPPRLSPPSCLSDSRYQINGGSAGWAANLESRAQESHLLLRPPDLFSPSLPPLLPPHSQATLIPPPPCQQGPSLYEAWGSGSYLERRSVLEHKKMTLTTPLPSHPSDRDNRGGRVSYDTSFPAHLTLPLSSQLPLSPSFIPSILLTPGVFPTWDEDYNSEDVMHLEPKELLPDMNSLENLLKEKGGGDQNKVKTLITPTATYTHHPPPNLSLNPFLSPGLDPKDPQSAPTPPLIISPTLTAEETTPAPKRPTEIIETQLQLCTTMTTHTTTKTKVGAITSTTQIPAISLTMGPLVTPTRVVQTPPTTQHLCSAANPEFEVEVFCF